MLGGLPAVFTSYFYSSVAPIVGDDVREVCKECVGHLISHGHREVAVICGPWVDANGFGLFVRGCKDSYEAASLPFHRRSVYHAYPDESLVELAKAVLSTDPRPTGVFAENWRVAESVIQAAAALGLSVPKDVSLIAYGQNVSHISAPVPITAHVPDSEGIGHRAAELLVEMLEGAPAPATPVILRGKLIQRQSVRTIALES
jgi:LacI family transcriptional regulator